MKKMTEETIKENLTNLKKWSYEKGFLVMTHKFKDFKEAFAVMSRIAFECEEQQHHPNWENVYNILTIRLQTHDAGGITQKDFALAASIEIIINP